MYRCNMTTATIHHTSTAAPAAPPPVDMDTRLTLAHAAMAVLLDVPAETHAALSGALKEADGLAVAGILRERQKPVQPHERPNETLRRAGDLIRRRGWTRGAYSTGTGICAMAAIREVLYGPTWSYLPADDRENDARDVLLARIAAEFGPGLSIPGWNDGQSSAGDVLRLLW